MTISTACATSSLVPKRPMGIRAGDDATPDRTMSVSISDGEIALTVNGQTKQHSDVNKLIWGIREIIADLSLFYHLQPGDLIYTGTPEGVGPVVAGDRIEGHVAGVGEVALNIAAAE